MKTDMPETTTSVRLTESTRVEAFSDTVTAIVITILVLELLTAEIEVAAVRLGPPAPARSRLRGDPPRATPQQPRVSPTRACGRCPSANN